MKSDIKLGILVTLVSKAKGVPFSVIVSTNFSNLIKMSSF